MKNDVNAVRAAGGRATLRVVGSESTPPSAWKPDRQSAIDTLGNRTESSPELTDDGNAERFVRDHGEDVRFVRQKGWLVWVGTHWTRDPLKARGLMQGTARGIHAEAALQSEKAKAKALTAWAKKSQSAPRLKAALWCAQPKLAAKHDDFDQQPMLLPASNGTIDLCDGHLYPHRREHYCTRLAPVLFDPNAECPTWLSFLERVLPNPEVRSFVARLVGYSLTGSTREQVLAFLYGSGRNGKSVFLETLAALLGGYHTATRIQTLTTTQGGIPNDVAALASARLVTVSETPEGSRLNESLIKDLTGGDLIAARFLRHEFFQFRPQFKLWIRGNHKPRIRGTDDGIWRRLLLIPFAVQIPPDEVDPDLPQKLLGELPGILAWAVRGCLSWQEHGLRPPDVVRAALNEYRDEMDTLGEFLSEHCIVGEDYKARAADLYGRYRRWAEESGHQAVSQTRFGGMLRERGFKKFKSGCVTWGGLGLMDN